MNFTTNYDDVESGILPEGLYECVIKSASMNVTKKGTEYFDVRLVIRNDVQQKYQNKYIFHSIWKKKEPSEADMQVDGFSFKQIMSLAKAVKVPAGKNYADLNEMGKDLIGRPVLAEIYHDTSSGQPNVRVKYVNESKYPDCKHVYKANTFTRKLLPPQAVRPMPGSRRRSLHRQLFPPLSQRQI